MMSTDWNDARDENDPRQSLEQREKHPAGEHRRYELREVRDESPAGEATQERHEREGGHHGQEPFLRPQRQREEDGDERHRHDHDRDEHDRGPKSHAAEMRRNDEPGDDTGAHSDERRDARAR